MLVFYSSLITNLTHFSRFYRDMLTTYFLLWRIISLPLYSLPKFTTSCLKSSRNFSSVHPLKYGAAPIWLILLNGKSPNRGLYQCLLNLLSDYEVWLSLLFLLHHRTFSLLRKQKLIHSETVAVYELKTCILWVSIQSLKFILRWKSHTANMEIK